MSGVKDRLDYLEETKNLIKEAIVTSEQVQYVIDHSIISQSILDELVQKSIIINGEEI